MSVVVHVNNGTFPKGCSSSETTASAHAPRTEQNQQRWKAPTFDAALRLISNNILIKSLSQSLLCSPGHQLVLWSPVLWSFGRQSVSSVLWSLVGPVVLCPIVTLLVTTSPVVTSLVITTLSYSHPSCDH